MIRRPDVRLLNATVSTTLGPSLALREARLVQAPHVNKVPRDSRCCRHRGTDKVCAATAALPTLEVAIGGRRTAFARGQPVRIHAQTHGAARLAPFEARLPEHLVEPFRLGLPLHQPGARYD